LRVTTVTEGLEHPWSLAFLPDRRLLVSERPGRLRLVDAMGRLDPEPVRGLPPQIAAVGQGGLLDVALHPGSGTTAGSISPTSPKGKDGYGTEVLRGRLQGKTLIDVQVIFRMLPKSSAGHHFGSRLVFDRQGFLFITLGDRGDQQRAQRLDDHAGSVIRLHDDGRIPADNPFVQQPGALPEKFTIGNRNIQGAALHPETGELWTHEHGPQGGDEINIIRAGVNYGWPVITFGRNYGHRNTDRRGNGQARHGPANAPMDTVDCALGNGFLHRRPFPGMAWRSLRRRPARPDAGPLEARGFARRPSGTVAQGRHRTHS
jgi:glucose/arabinose dehydrogenase